MTGAAGYLDLSSRGKAAPIGTSQVSEQMLYVTCMDAQHTKHVTYKLAYPFVWCPKYRKKILVGRLATFIQAARSLLKAERGARKATFA